MDQIKVPESERSQTEMKQADVEQPVATTGNTSLASMDVHMATSDRKEKVDMAPTLSEMSQTNISQANVKKFTTPNVGENQSMSATRLDVGKTKDDANEPLADLRLKQEDELKKTTSICVSSKDPTFFEILFTE